MSCLLDMQDIEALLRSVTEGQSSFTRRMAITMADMDGSTPMAIVRRRERLRLLRRGSSEWFVHHGGITREHIAEVRAERSRVAPSSTEDAA